MLFHARYRCQLLFLVFCFPWICDAVELSTNDLNSLWSGVLEKGVQSADRSESFSRLLTAPSEGPSYIATQFQTPVSLVGQYVRVKMRINSIESWGGIELRLSSDSNGSFENFMSIAIPFYSDTEFNILQEDQWAEITLSLGEAVIHGSPDVQNISSLGFYVAGQQNQDPFVVDFKDLKIEPAVLPAVVSMTFDDGYADHYQAAKIMHQYGLRGTAYVMTREIDQDGYLTSAQLQEMAQAMGWAISSHHKIPITEFTNNELEAEIDQTFNFLENLGLSRSVPHFAYPLGKQSRQTTLPSIRNRFLTARIAGGGAETLPPSDWHMLRTYNVTPDKTPAMILERVAKAV